MPLRLLPLICLIPCVCLASDASFEKSIEPFLKNNCFQCHNAKLKVGGLTSFTTLGPDTLKEIRAAFMGIDSHTHVSRFIDMHDLTGIYQALSLIGLGIVLIGIGWFYQRLLFPRRALPAAATN